MVFIGRHLPARIHGVQSRTVSGAASWVSAWCSSVVMAVSVSACQGMDKLLKRVYRCFEGSEEDRVDWRDIVCSFWILREHKQIRYNVMHVLMMIYDAYSILDQRLAIKLEDLQRIFRYLEAHDLRLCLSGTRRVGSSLAYLPCLPRTGHWSRYQQPGSPSLRVNLWPAAHVIPRPCPPPPLTSIIGQI
jgi:hypothetical protein